jgi:hypothetical protein
VHRIRGPNGGSVRLSVRILTTAVTYRNRLRATACRSIITGCRPTIGLINSRWRWRLLAGRAVGLLGHGGSGSTSGAGPGPLDVSQQKGRGSQREARSRAHAKNINAGPHQRVPKSRSSGLQRTWQRSGVAGGARWMHPLLNRRKADRQYLRTVTLLLAWLMLILRSIGLSLAPALSPRPSPRWGQ